MVSLILLLVMTIIGVAAMNGARLEVSIAGMMQQEEVALRSAERGLTAAELYVENFTGTFDESVDGHYLPEDELDATATDWGNIVSLDSTDVSELGEHEEFVVEYLGIMTLPGSRLSDDGDATLPAEKAKVYRITTRSGTDGNAVRIVESIYTKAYNPMDP